MPKKTKAILEAEIEDLKKHYSELNALYATQTDEMILATQRIQGLEEQIEHKTKTIHFLNRDIAELSGKLVEKDYEIAALKEALDIDNAIDAASQFVKDEEGIFISPPIHVMEELDRKKITEELSMRIKPLVDVHLEVPSRTVAKYGFIR